ncbi:hypothetical protein D3C72_2208470 [compost metagenome]
MTAALEPTTDTKRAELLGACRERLHRSGPDAELLLRVQGDPGNREHVRFIGKGTPKGHVVTADGEGNTIARFGAADVADYLLGRGKYHAHDDR